MKNKILILLLIIIALYGCAFEEQKVPDPKPAPKINFSPIDENNPNTFVGKYMVNGLQITNSTTLDTSYMDGFVQLQLTPDGKIEYNYDLTYSGYSNDKGKRKSNKQYAPLGEYTIQDNRTISLSKPISITDDKYTYTISSLQKYDNDKTSLDNTTEVNKIFYKYAKLCDPQVESGANSCTNSSETGALSYIGYYRIEKITCNNNEYTGGQDFAGEMVATPSLDRLGADIVDLPLDIKVQIKNSNLKTCFLKTSEQNDKNLYLKHLAYEIVLGDTLELDKIFTQVGLNGLKNENNEAIRTTEIDFKPKTPEEYQDMTFGDGNNSVIMRLKIIKQGNVGQVPVRVLDDNTYFDITK